MWKWFVVKTCVKKVLIRAVHNQWQTYIYCNTCIISSVLVPDVSEDSVDIYDGLDIGFISNAGKSPQWKFHLAFLLHIDRSTHLHLFTTEADFLIMVYFISLVIWFITESSPDASQLKESMDLYEEIVTEEQRNRESSYAEVSSCLLHTSFFSLDFSHFTSHF